MRKPDLVASDVDGTLIDLAERVSERTARSVRSVEASGTPFVLVTGRPPRWVPRIADALGVAGITVCSNGAVIYDSAADRVLDAFEIGPELLADAIGELRRALPGCAFGVERATDSAADRADEQFLAEEDFRKVWPNRDIRVASAAELISRPASKLLVLHSGMTSGQMAAEAEKALDTWLVPTYSTRVGLIELSLPGADKAGGLSSVVEDLGVDRANTIAFGDMPNDIPMLDWVGHGVAMRDGHPDVLAIADEITATNVDDGVAQVLERWF